MVLAAIEEGQPVPGQVEPIAQSLSDFFSNDFILGLTDFQITVNRSRRRDRDGASCSRVMSHKVHNRLGDFEAI